MRSFTSDSTASTQSSRSSRISWMWMSSRSVWRCSRSCRRSSKWDPQLSATAAVLYWAEAKFSSDCSRSSTASSRSLRSASESERRFSHRSHRSEERDSIPLRRLSSSSNMLRVFVSITPLARWNRVKWGWGSSDSSTGRQDGRFDARCQPHAGAARLSRSEQGQGSKKEDER